VGAVGVAVLLSLGIWQMQRLAWKDAILTDIETRIAAAPVPLPNVASPELHRFLPVIVDGEFPGRELHVLVSQKIHGAGYRIIAAFKTGGRKILVDRGYVGLDAKDAARAPVAGRVTGNLHWPDETDGFTPEPDKDRQIWFARDVGAMAAALGTEPLLVVARNVSPSNQSVTPLHGFRWRRSGQE
jgi:surfeit locus 1 family protein